MKKFKHIIVFFIASLSVFGQDSISIKKYNQVDDLIIKSQKASRNGNMYLALEHAVEAAKGAHKLEDPYYLSMCYFLIGNIHYEIIDYKTAKENLNRALEYSKKSENETLIPRILNNLANVYYDDKKDYKGALTYYKESVSIFKNKIEKKPEEVNMTSYETLIINLTWTYMDLNEFDNTAPYLKEIDSLIFSPTGSEGNKSSYYLLKARNYAHYVAIDSAEAYFEKALKQLDKQSSWVKGKSYFYEYRSEMYERIKNYPLALADKNSLIENERKVYDFTKSKLEEMAKSRFKLNEYEAKFEANKRENQLYQNIDKKNKKIIYITLSGLILLMILVVLYYKAYKSKKRISETLELKNSELSEANQKAEKLSKIKSQFISTISYELRTPLYGVVGISSILLENDKKSEKDKKLLNSLKFSADYLLDLVNKVLKVSKIDSEEKELIKTPTDIFSLSQNILQSFDYQSQKKENTLILKHNHSIPKLLNVDALRVSEVLINLIGNAIKFTDKGRIWLRIKLLDNDSKIVRIRFEVEDTGMGVPEDQKEYIFEEFSQIGSVYDNKQGTGLGLSIVKNLVQVMGSQINFESKKGVGSIFYFDLDLEISESLNDLENGLENTIITENVSAKILVAEDNKVNQLVTKNLLKNIGCICTIVENGLEAVQILKKETFDLVLMDINMPVMDGMQATLKIREFDKTTPIIALTASELSEVGDECTKAGMNDLINKPLNKKDLREAIDKNLIINNSETKG
ncbi:response regulator [Aquimarina sp. 2201CG14-23]|uniref:response regulator n=1 Tax=Aquimarina mycalae TaxID=3040073 RepID=UPI0024782280|nr:response regulator [Aquimarina sp. 2201CG14-23]MDH7447442.1 response regulator [Aquimarina sp. 2201CG14-23]